MLCACVAERLCRRARAQTNAKSQFKLIWIRSNCVLARLGRPRLLRMRRRRIVLHTKSTMGCAILNWNFCRFDDCIRWGAEETTDDSVWFCFQDLLTNVKQISFFSSSSQFQMFDISFNRIRELTKRSFARYLSIRFLYMFENMIRTVEEGTFSQLTNLEVTKMTASVDINTHSHPKSNSFLYRRERF